MAQKTNKHVDPGDIFTELGFIMAKHGYKPTEEETRNVLKMRGGLLLKNAATSLRPTLVRHVAQSAAAPITPDLLLVITQGWRLMFSIIAAGVTTGTGSTYAGHRCLQMLAHQPGPMGGEVCELIKQRDPESPILRHVPARMEGDPLARIAPWRSEGEGDAQDRTPVHNSNPAISMPSTGADPAAGAPSKEGLQEPSQAAAGWGDMGEFSMAPLDAPAFSGAEQSQQPEQRQQHSCASRRSRSEERRQRRQQHQGTTGGNEEMQNYFDRRWEEPPPK